MLYDANRERLPSSIPYLASWRLEKIPLLIYIRSISSMGCPISFLWSVLKIDTCSNYISFGIHKSVADPKLLISDPDPSFQSITDPDRDLTFRYRIRIRLFTSFRIWIRSLFGSDIFFIRKKFIFFQVFSSSIVNSLKCKLATVLFKWKKVGYTILVLYFLDSNLNRKKPGLWIRNY